MAKAVTSTTARRGDNLMSPGALIIERIEALARLSDDPRALTRLYLDPAHRQACDVVAAWMRAAGMATHVDALATVVGRYEGARADAPTLLIGSHIDSVRDAGKFDGTLGVLCAIAVVERLQAQGRRLPFAIEVLAFGDEEGVRYPRTLTGSRAVAGRFDARTLDDVDAAGLARRDTLKAFGCNVAEIAAIARAPGQVLGYLEVHIEQGPVLEAKNLPVGVVTAINGASRGRITIKGEAGHAGTVPMGLRHDAAAAAAAMTMAIESIARATTDLVATVGIIEVPHGAINVVAGAAELSLDVRSPSDAARQAAVDAIRKAVDEIAAARGVTATMTMTYAAAAAPCAAPLMDALGAAIAAEGLQETRLASGAGHDAMSFKDVIPFAMLFVRCAGGISHNPAEHATLADIDVAARVLIRAVERLAAGSTTATGKDSG